MTNLIWIDWRIASLRCTLIIIAWASMTFAVTGAEMEQVLVDSCLNQKPGDVNNNGVIDGSDVVTLNSLLVGNIYVLPNYANADVNGDCVIDTSDVLRLQDYLAGGTPPVTCTCVTPYFCRCIAGDVDGSGGFQISDAVFMVQYIFAGGPPPHGYCNGDSNCDCMWNISDVVNMINFIFLGLPWPPQYCNSCLEWIRNCEKIIH